MSAVTTQEIIEALLNPPGWVSAEVMVARIKQHGIAPPDGRTPVAWAIDTPYGRAYSFVDEVIGKWTVPDGLVLVPEVATEQIIEAIIERGNQHGDDISYDTAVLIWNDAIIAAETEVSND